jgi:hypothetical protein
MLPPTRLMSPSFQRKGRKWKGAYADEEAIIKWIMSEKNVSKDEAKKLASTVLATLKKRGEAVKQAYPGLKDDKFDYDLFQDVVIGADRQPPNCFGDVCKGAKQRWEPTKKELDDWLAAEKYVKTTNTGCECGKEKVAVYDFTLEYTDGSAAKTLVQPFHIAHQQEDCTWRSRLGDLGVIIHERAEQLLSQVAAEFLAKDVAKIAGMVFKKGTGQVTCFARPHAKANYHGAPGGTLTCGNSKGSKAKK